MGGGAHGFSTLKAGKLAFTLAETLITLGVIGVVAALTLPALISKYQDLGFKSAYKKAYSEFSQSFQEPIFNSELSRSGKFDESATEHELQILKSKLKVLKDCNVKGEIAECWKLGEDTVCSGSCSGGGPDTPLGTNGVPGQNREKCFIDVSGRSWCTFNNDENIFFVDTNGLKNPNRFGKDRFLFTFADENDNRCSTAKCYKKIIPYSKDITIQTTWCQYPPCYYESWLLK